MPEITDLEGLIAAVDAQDPQSVQDTLEVAGEILFTLPEDRQNRILSLWVTSVQSRCVETVNEKKRQLDEEHAENHERLKAIAQKFAT